MENTKMVVFMVTYQDDNHKKHITFVQKYSEVKFLKDRFGDIKFELTDFYPYFSEEDN